VTPKERVARGRAARAEVPRSSHGEWASATTRPDPVAVLEKQAQTRAPDLVPLRHARMLVSPFTFYRGAAAGMAADLAGTPSSGIKVQVCGDAHLANFGGFESPERDMLFDINDFDETLPGPWEWDVKRLAASFVIAGQDRAFDDAVTRGAVIGTVRAYREAMRGFAGMRNLEVWYARLDVQSIINRWRRDVSKADVKLLQRQVAKARSKNSLKAFAKLTEQVDGKTQFVSDPPVLVRVEDLFPGDEVERMSSSMRGWVRSYRKTLQWDRGQLLDTYVVEDFARKVVGVGSVGTRCWVVAMLGRDSDDPLILQIKEAEASVLEPHVGRSHFANHGQRVVEGQRFMQAASDIFLGWDRAEGADGTKRDFYVRQLWDGKMSADLETIPVSWLPVYGQMCGWTLARAHARTGDRIAIAAYLGGSDVFDRAIADFAYAYAEQNRRDYDTVSAAAKDGRLPVAASP
jgi:uncharacterized protein (DUF2252 family)